MNTVSELAKLRRDIESLNRRLTGARESIATANFLVLVDTPANYVGDAAKFVQVNVGEDALEFALITAEDIQAGTFPIGEYTFQSVVTGIFPILGDHLAIKEYVDLAINMEADFFFTDTLHAIAGIYYQMVDSPTEEAESTFISAPLGGGDGQVLVNWATNSGVPGTLALPGGVFGCHIHASKSGNRSVRLYYEVYKRTDPGGVETLLLTSEVSDLVTAKAGFEIHASIATETDLDTTDILVIKWYANLGTGNPTTITLYAEGTSDSHLKVPVESSIFNNIYVRRDGVTPLTGDWDSGAFGIYNQSWIHLNDDGAELRLGVEVDDYTIQWDGSDAVHTIVAGDFVFLGGFTGFGIAAPTGYVTISYGDFENSGALSIGADVGTNTSRTNVTRKYGAFTLPHYTNAEEPVAIFTAESDVAISFVALGGSASGFNSPMEVRIFTSPDTMTTSGVERVKVDSSGDVHIITGNLHVSTDSKELRLGNETNDYTIQWNGSDAVHTIITGDFVFLGGNFGVNTAVPTDQLEVVSSTDYRTIRMTDTKSNNATQRLALVGQHYTSAEEPVDLVGAFIGPSDNNIYIGGPNGNSATGIFFNTAANTTTLGGATRMRIASDGGIFMPGMKSGTDQADAGADAGELYFDTNDDNAVKMGV